jgi:hypothetical protein
LHQLGFASDALQSSFLQLELALFKVLQPEVSLRANIFLIRHIFDNLLGFVSFSCSEFMPIGFDSFVFGVTTASVRSTAFITWVKTGFVLANLLVRELTW